MISNLDQNDYAGLITEINAARNRALGEDAETVIGEFFASVGWHYAKLYTSELTAMAAIPPNVYGWLQARHAKEMAAFDVQPSQNTAPSAKFYVPPASQEWAARYMMVASVIGSWFLRYMASRDAKGALLIAPIPNGEGLSMTFDVDGYSELERACPQGWYPVIMHFCVGKYERRVSYSCEFPENIRKKDKSCGKIFTHYHYDPNPHDPVWVRVSGTSEEAEFHYMNSYEIALNDYRVKHMVQLAAVAKLEPREPSDNMSFVGDVVSAITDAERIITEINTLVDSLDAEKKAATQKYVEENREDVNKLTQMLNRIKAVAA
jgi:hypothetical protein